MLNEKEKKCIELKAQGLKLEEIAAKLFFSKRYMDIFINRLYQKTGTRNGSSLVKWGYENGVLKINAETLSSKTGKAG